MARQTDTFDLGRLALSSGEGRRLDLEVRLGPLEFAGQSYAPTPARTAVRLDVSRTTSGYSLRLRFDARLSGPCVRCLEEAWRGVGVDAREVDQPGDGEELRSPYVDGDELDLGAWARDALVLAMPAQVICGEECLGLCAVCGENLNQAGLEHAHERAPDPRWAALSELRFD